jgi:hypothetical protein
MILNACSSWLLVQASIGTVEGVLQLVGVDAEFRLKHGNTTFMVSDLISEQSTHSAKLDGLSSDVNSEILRALAAEASVTTFAAVISSAVNQLTSSETSRALAAEDALQLSLTTQASTIVATNSRLDSVRSVNESLELFTTIFVRVQHKPCFTLE